MTPTSRSVLTTLPHLCYAFVLFLLSFKQPRINNVSDLLYSLSFSSHSHKDVNTLETDGFFAAFFLESLFNFLQRIKDLVIHFSTGFEVDFFADSLMPDPLNLSLGFSHSAFNENESPAFVPRLSCCEMRQGAGLLELECTANRYTHLLSIHLYLKYFTWA